MAKAAGPPQRKAKETIKFSDETIENRNYSKDGQKLYWDSARQNVTLLVGKRTKTFRYHFKFNGRWISAKLGKFSDTFRVKDAYLKASEIDVKVADNKYVRIRRRKPGEKKEKGQTKVIETQPPQVTDPTDQTYLQVVKDYIQLSAKVTQQRSWKECERMLTKDFADWHDRLFKSITRQEARAKVRGFLLEGKGKEGEKKPAPGKARMARAWIRRLWRWAVDNEIVEQPIMDRIGVDLPKLSRTRVYTDAEIAAIWKAAEHLHSPDKTAYIRILILTGSRKTALAAARWSDIIKGNVWITPFKYTKSRPHSSDPNRKYLTPLSKLTMSILASLPRTEGGRIFPKVPLHPNQNELRILVRNGAPPDLIYYQLRHTLSTWLENKGASIWERGLVLNHQESGVTSGYSHGYPIDVKRELLERWAAHIAELVK